MRRRFFVRHPHFREFTASLPGFHPIRGRTVARCRVDSSGDANAAPGVPANSTCINSCAACWVPQSSFVPAFAAPTMTTTPAGPPSTSMPFQHPGHPAGVSGASSQEIDAVGQSSSNVTMPQSISQSAPSSTNGAEASVNHVVTVHISDTTTTTSTTAETATQHRRPLKSRESVRRRIFNGFVTCVIAFSRYFSKCKLRSREASPRLVTRKISALLTTPANNLPAVKKALIDLGETESPHAVETINSFCQKPSKEIRLAVLKHLVPSAPRVIGNPAAEVS